jgi:hypothetical protein
VLITVQPVDIPLFHPQTGTRELSLASSRI